MKLQDMIRLRGEVSIKIIRKDGSSLTFVEDNLIVLNGRTNICDFLIGSPSSYIYDIAFGSGGTVAGNINVAKPVLPEDNTLNIVLPADKDVDYSFVSTRETSPSPRSIFSVVVPMDSPALNGKSISELGLMLNTTPNTAFAIKRFPAISKSDTISLIITWTIYV